MKQPYVYTMPEAFLHDEGVPARWKVLAIVQGFWISGRTVFATNEWIQKQLGYSRRQVQYALSELEKMNLISRNVKGMNRLILPGGAIGLHGGVQSHDQKSAVGLHHNSVSNSDNIILGAEAPESEYEFTREPTDSEGSPLSKREPKKARADKDVLELFALFAPINPAWELWHRNTTQREAAKLLLKRYGFEKTKKLLAASQRVKADQFAPQVHSPNELLNKLANLKDHEERGN